MPSWVSAVPVVVDTPLKNGRTANENLFGERLVRSGVLTDQHLQQALAVQSRTEAFLGQILVDLGFVSASTVGRQLASTIGVRYVDLGRVQPQAEAVTLVSASTLRAANTLPFRMTGDTVDVAMLDPLDVSAIDKAVACDAGRTIAGCTIYARTITGRTTSFSITGTRASGGDNFFSPPRCFLGEHQ